MIRIALVAASAAALVSRPPRIARHKQSCVVSDERGRCVAPTTTPPRSLTARRNALDDFVATATAFLEKLGAPAKQEWNASAVLPGVISRCAAKKQEFSRAKGWTTNKPSQPGFLIGPSGCGDDFNNYRTKALNGTADRAVSILTVDVLQSLRSEGWPVNEGDLGENIYVAGMPYRTFGLGRRFSLGAAIVQITEPIVPCGYLCTLPYLAQKWRCQDFIRTLNNRRGWYARVLTPGPAAVGDPVVALP